MDDMTMAEKLAALQALQAQNTPLEAGAQKIGAAIQKPFDKMGSAIDDAFSANDSYSNVPSNLKNSGGTQFSPDSYQSDDKHDARWKKIMQDGVDRERAANATKALGTPMPVSTPPMSQSDLDNAASEFDEDPNVQPIKRFGKIMPTGGK